MQELQSEKIKLIQLNTQYEDKLKEFERLQEEFKGQKEKNEILLKEVIEKIQMKA